VALVELSGYGDGQVTPLRLAPGERAVIGRVGDDLVLRLGNDQWVSARHAQVWEDEGGWWLEDLRSRNGTILLDTQAQLEAHSPAPLKLGAMFRVGHTDLLLTDDPQVMRETSQGA
jgi:pSer/pThr/pTyr-binding forkhead associated (FHA) protein